MAGIRRTICICVLCVLAFLSNIIGIPTCLGNDEVPHDIVLIKSFVTPLSASLHDALAIHRVGFSKNGQLLACLCNAPGFPGFGDVYLWDVKTGKCVRQVRPLSEWKGVVLRPDGPIEFPYYFTTVPYARLCFRTTTGLEVQDDLAKPGKRPIRLDLLDGSAEIEQGGVYFSIDDKYLAAVRKDDRSVNVWDVRSGERIRRFALPDIDTIGVRSLAFDSTARYLAAGIDHYSRPDIYGAVIVWDLKTGVEVLNTDEELRVIQVTFCANGDLICGESGRGFEDPGRITIRKSRDFDDARTFHTPCSLWSIAVVPQVGLVTGDSNGQVLLWDIETGRLLSVGKENGQHVASLAVGPSGKLLASGDWDSVARLWKIATGPAPK